MILPKYNYCPFILLGGNGTDVNAFALGVINGGQSGQSPSISVLQGSILTDYTKIFYDDTYIYFVGCYNTFLSNFGMRDLAVEKIDALPEGVTQYIIQ
jgi:hypothetical protein